MIKQFRSLTPINIGLLILATFLLRFPVWGYAHTQQAADFSELYRHLLWPYPNSPLFDNATQLALGFVCLVAQALLFNTVVNTHNLLGKASFMPALLFIVCGSFFESFASFGPVQICNFLIIWMLNRYLNMYRQSDVKRMVYDLGMAVAVGAILYTPFLILFPIIWISLMIFRPFNAREWFIALLGFLTIVFFLIFYYYWNDAHGNFINSWRPVRTSNLYSKLNYWTLLPLVIIGILGLVQLRQNFFRSVVHIRKSFQLLSAFFLAAILSSSPSFGADENHFLLAVAPLSVLLAYYFMHATRRWIYEGLFLVLIACIIYGQMAAGFNFF